MPLGTAPPSHATGGPALYPNTDDIRRDAIVGHRLEGGFLSVHAPGEPCGLCEAASSIPASWRLAGTTSGAQGR